MHRLQLMFFFQVQCSHKSNIGPHTKFGKENMIITVQQSHNKPLKVNKNKDHKHGKDRDTGKGKHVLVE